MVLLLAEVAHHSPVRLGHSEPLAVPGPDVDVDGAEVVVLLVARDPAPRHLHVELDRVHAQDGVTHVAEQVAGGDDSREGRQFAELLQLLLPPGEKKLIHFKKAKREQEL